ncbi:hypothetical protein CPT_Suzuki_013 [Stenotrophomonas phage Suzuki]|nr:hypothetical protein CPT_Suzuki_013 [Stenotrophomonas phage Suzuki]
MGPAGLPKRKRAGFRGRKRTAVKIWNGLGFRSGGFFCTDGIRVRGRAHAPARTHARAPARVTRLTWGRVSMNARRARFVPLAAPVILGSAERRSEK